MFDINIELRDFEPEVYRIDFTIDSNVDEKETAK